MNMIERVARAMCRTDNGDGYEARWEFYKALATAAIEAMLKPSIEMARVGVDEGMGFGVEVEDTARIYTAMIDAALNEQVSG